VSKQTVEPERITDAENVGRRIAVETEAEVEVDLLGVGDAVAATGIEQVTAAAIDRVVADIFDEEKGAFGDLLLDHES